VAERNAAPSSSRRVRLTRLGAGCYACYPLNMTIEKKQVGSVHTNAGMNGLTTWEVHRNGRTAMFDTLDDVRGFIAGLANPYWEGRQ